MAAAVREATRRGRLTQGVTLLGTDRGVRTAARMRRERDAVVGEALTLHVGETGTEAAGSRSPLHGVHGAEATRHARFVELPALFA